MTYKYAKSIKVVVWSNTLSFPPCMQKKCTTQNKS